MLDISNDWDTDSIIAAKNKFFATIHSLTVKIKKNNKKNHQEDYRKGSH